MTTVNVEAFVCPECGNLINTTDNPDIDHHSDCPTRTNWWTVHYGTEVLCFLCDQWLLEGDPYRLLPKLPEELDIDPEDALGMIITETKVVCAHCCRFTALPGGLRDTDAQTG